MATNEATNDEEWVQAEGVPSLSDPFIQKYLQGRDALVQQEKRQRSGWWPRITLPNYHEHRSDSLQITFSAKTSHLWHKKHAQ